MNIFPAMKFYAYLNSDILITSKLFSALRYIESLHIDKVIVLTYIDFSISQKNQCKIPTEINKHNIQQHRGRYPGIHKENEIRSKMRSSIAIFFKMKRMSLYSLKMYLIGKNCLL